MLSVLHEDNHLLVVDKPAGIATMGAESGPTVHSMAADYIKQRYNKPGKAFVGTVSRLDTMTSGVLVLARTSKAASRLTPQFGGNQKTRKPLPRADKVYIAAIEGHLDGDSGSLVDFVRKDDAARRMRVVDQNVSGAQESGAQEACLDYVVLGRTDAVTLVAVRLRTGRKHQIRVQFAASGNTVWGDRKYGSRESFAGIALHSFMLQISHPTLTTRMLFSVEPPKSWKPFDDALPSMSDLRETVAKRFDIELAS